MGRPRTCSCNVCPKCKQRKYMSVWYKAHKHTPQDKEKQNALARDRWANDPEYRRKKMARILSGQQVRRGTVTPEPCIFCGQQAVTHHNDYNKPYERTWLCPKHHCLIHDALPED